MNPYCDLPALVQETHEHPGVAPEIWRIYFGSWVRSTITNEVNNIGTVAGTITNAQGEVVWAYRFRKQS